MAGLPPWLSAGTALAQKKYDPGATDKEIKIGSIEPVLRPGLGLRHDRQGDRARTSRRSTTRAASTAARSSSSVDDGYNPAKTVEQARKLVEQEEVLFIFNSLGTPTNSAIHKYMNAKKVPQLFVATGATKWGDPKNFPWTIGWQPNYQAEAQIYAAAHPGDQAEREDRACSTRTTTTARTT